MAGRADFNADEWALVAQAPALAGLKVIAASRGGSLRESVSMARVYAEAREARTAGLVGELVAAPPALDPRTTQDLVNQGVGRLREALHLVEERGTPEDVKAFKHFVLDVAEAVAKAHKEGGFLGIGGTLISEGEREVLREIASALDVTYT